MMAHRSAVNPVEVRSDGKENGHGRYTSIGSLTLDTSIGESP
jgi:hypothetical protein